MKSSKIGLIGLSVAVAIGAANFAHAEDILLAHDRGLYIDTFNEIGSQVGVTVEHASYGDVNQYKAYIQNSILTGDEPDIFVWWGGRAFEDIVDTGIASNVDSYWDNMIEIGRFPASIRSPYTVNGESFGLPFGVAHWMTWYHKDKFAEAGIDTAPTTWAELEAVADKLIAAGITPFNASIEGGWRGFIWFEEIFIRTNPEAFAGLFTGETAYDSEPVREVFKIWADLYARGWFSDPRSEQEQIDWAGGNAAMYIWAENGPAIFVGLGMDPDNLGVFHAGPIDTSLAPAAIIEPAVLVLTNSGAENPAAVKYIENWLGSGMETWGRGSGWWPGALDLMLPNQHYVDSYAVKAEIPELQSILRWWEASATELQFDITSELIGFMLNPTMEQAESAMANMQAINSAYWADQ